MTHTKQALLKNSSQIYSEQDMLSNECHKIILRRLFHIKKTDMLNNIISEIDELHLTSCKEPQSTNQAKELVKLKDALDSLPRKNSIKKVQSCLKDIKTHKDEWSPNDKIHHILKESCDFLDQYIKIKSEVDKAGTCGLALSGGGIRAASFNLGLLQALHAKGFLQTLDYLSTVSGGGYIGAAYSYFVKMNKDGKFPFIHNNNVVQSIRRKALYLTPGHGLNNWALIAALMRGILINLALIIPLVLGMMWLLTYICTEISSIYIKPEWVKEKNHIVIVVCTGYLFIECVRVFLKRWPQNDENDWWKHVPWCLLVAIFLSVILLGYLFTLLDNSHLLAFILIPIYLVFTCGLICVFKAEFWQKKSTNAEKIPGLIQPPLSPQNFPKIFHFVFEFLAWAVVFWTIDFLSGTQMISNLEDYPAYMYISLVGYTILSRLLVANIFYAALSQTPFRLKFVEDRFFSVQYGDYLLWGCILLFIGFIPLLYDSMINFWHFSRKEILSSISLTGVASTVIGWFTRRQGSELRGYVAFFLRTGIILILVSGLLWAYHIIECPTFKRVPENVWTLLWVAVLWFIAVIVVDINYVSMHRYYRNRLVETFLPPTQSEEVKNIPPLHIKDIDIVKTHRTPGINPDIILYIILPDCIRKVGFLYPHEKYLDFLTRNGNTCALLMADTSKTWGSMSLFDASVR